MKILIKNAYLYDAQGERFYRGGVLIGGERILAVGNIRASADLTLDANEAFILPGFVDIHTHGRDGYDFTSADEVGLRKMAKGYLKNCTTTLMPTFGSAPSVSMLADAGDRINKIKGNTGGANFEGIHLEGRFLNPAKRGAHAPEMLTVPNVEEIEGLIDHMKFPCHISAALELDSSGFAHRARMRGATLGLAHTCATYDEAIELYEKYGISFTHTWNAMPPLHHRGGGAVAAGLISDAYCELICDGIHIAPDVVKLTYRAKGTKRLALITDSIEAAGMPDGRYSIAGMGCTVKDGIARTDDGALAGSTLDMKTAVENLAAFCNIPLSKALRCATLTPAETVGIDGEVGSLEAGKRADMIIARIDKKKISPEKLICRGQPFGGEGE